MRLWFVCAVVVVAPAVGKEKTEHFDKDPGWEGVNNRATTPEKRAIKQDFGYSRTNHAGGQPGEVGGFITPAAEPACYARKIEPKTFRDPLTASGKLRCDGRGHVLIAFFNADTANEWRTPNCIAIRLLGRGDMFYAYVEYCTGRWRAGGDSPGGFATAKDETGRMNLRGFRTDRVHEWTLKYDPTGNKGGGSITVTLGEETAVCHLDAGHQADGATFNRFGLLPVLKSADGGGEVWLDDVTINGATDDFAKDPQWEGVNNRREYVTADVRPRFDFGYTPTRHAGGLAAGELGGLVFRGDCRYMHKLAAYGDRLAELSLDKPLKASGKVALRRAVSDSTVLIGFYHSRDSLEVNSSQDSGWPKSFLGVAIEGPSREGFLVYPAYRVGAAQGYAGGNDRPHILPDGKPHDWSLTYEPRTGGGRMTVTLDGKSVLLDLGKDRPATRFDRFGLVTTWIDGNAQRIHFDDLAYTCEQ
ncbi:MAG TPA: hypothetical protein VKD90_11870 [Gemmataceae bacterium]|nr:hypothetical protein [Gemmataceae bacterium]